MIILLCPGDSVSDNPQTHQVTALLLSDPIVCIVAIFYLSTMFS